MSQEFGKLPQGPTTSLLSPGVATVKFEVLQEALREGQEALSEGQEALSEGQEALRSTDKLKLLKQEPAPAPTDT